MMLFGPIVMVTWSLLRMATSEVPIALSLSEPQAVPVADEVVARTEVYHLKNKLKALITGDRIRINPKNIQAYEEDNHANLVALSNEAMPVVLEEDDRRHAMIWTPEKLTEDFYKEVLADIRAAALVRKREIVHPDRARKCYTIEGTTHGPHGILLLGNSAPPWEYSGNEAA